MRVSVLLSILSVVLLAAVWVAVFLGPGLQAPRWSVVLLIDDAAAPGPQLGDWAQNARRFARQTPGTGPVLRESWIDDDLVRAGYKVADDIADPIAWLDARMRDEAPFFLALHAGRAGSERFEQIAAHLERTGLARRTILAAWTPAYFAFDMPGQRTAPVRDRLSEEADIVPTLLRLIGLTPSLPLPGRALAG